MSDRNYGPNAPYLVPDNLSYETVVFVNGKPVAAEELNLLQDIQFEANAQKVRELMPSGFVKGDFLRDDFEDYSFGMTPNTFSLVNRPVVNVNGWLIPLEYTGTSFDGWNSIELPAPPVGTGVAFDFVYLEVWRSLIQANPSTDNKPSATQIYPHGNVLADPATWITEDLLDPDVTQQLGDETTRRVQVQYAIRTTRLAGPSRLGYNDANVEAQGPQGAPIAGRTFSAVTGDPGLWRAGDELGSGSEIPGTIDGFVYSIPLCIVYRRNDGAWDNPTNTNGSGLISSGTTSRPDFVFSDQIIAEDLFDLRKAVNPSVRYEQVLEKNLSLLLDNRLKTWSMGPDQTTQWNIGFNQGYGNRYLKCDVILANNSTSANGNEIRHGDGICYTFSDRSVVQRHTVVFDAATYANGGAGGNWAAGNVISFNIPDVNYFSTSGWSTGNEAYISDVVNVFYQEGHVGFDQEGVLVLDVRQIRGLGTDTVEVELGDFSFFTDQDLDIWIEYEITYLAGGGLTSYVDEALNQYSLSGPTSQIPVLDFEEGPHRELTVGVLDFPLAPVSYIGNVAARVIGGQIVVFVPLPIRAYVPDMNNPGNSFTVTNQSTSTVYTVLDYDAQNKRVILDEQELNNDTGADPSDPIEVVYTELRPLVNSNQLSVYYNAPAIQAVPEDLLPNTLEVEPLHLPKTMYTGVASSGSPDTSYPYEAPLNQIPVSSGAGDSYQGEQSFDASALVSVTGFDARTGLLQIPVYVPLANVDSITFQNPSSDVHEFSGHYLETDAAEYLPAVFGPSLSSPIKHKTFYPFLAKLKQDTDFARAGEIVMVILTQYFGQDTTLPAGNKVEDNRISFGNNTHCAAAIYKTKGNWLSH